MKKVFISVVVIIIFVGILFVAYNKGLSKGFTRGRSNGIEYQIVKEDGQYDEIRSAMTEEIVTRESEDYLVLDKDMIFCQQPVYLRLEDYLNDPSVLTCSKIRRLTPSRLEDFQEIKTDKQWQELIATFGYSEEDALVIMFVPHLVELNKDEKSGFTSLALAWLPEFDISNVNINRLRYKLEILAWKYGYTTEMSDGPLFTDDGKRFNFELAYPF